VRRARPPSQGAALPPTSSICRPAEDTLYPRAATRSGGACLNFASQIDEVRHGEAVRSCPRHKGKDPQWLPSSHGSRGWNAGGRRLPRSVAPILTRPKSRPLTP
jgi:hypothetical protein